jgi:hypothetical protein
VLRFANGTFGGVFGEAEIGTGFGHGAVAFMAKAGVTIFGTGAFSAILTMGATPNGG